MNPLIKEKTCNSCDLLPEKWSKKYCDFWDGKIISQGAKDEEVVVYPGANYFRPQAS